ncbi:MAG: DUF2723 domain-containing protein, partial [Bacteroidota bacterium]
VQTQKHIYIQNSIGFLLWIGACCIYLFSDILITNNHSAQTLTAAYTLGISDSPGHPLYMIIGRIAALFSEPDSFLNTMRIVSVLAASTTIILVYFSVVSIAQYILFRTEQKNNSHVLIFTVGIISATSLLFSTSFWNSARSPGIDVVSTLFVALLCWITIKWYTLRHSASGNRYILLTVLILSLGISIDPYILLVFPAIFTVYYSTKHPPSFTNSLIGFGYGVGISIFIWALFFRILPFIAAQIDSAAHIYVSLPVNAGMALFYILLFGTIITTLFLKYKKQTHSHFIILLITLLFMGQLPHAYIIIRSNNTLYTQGEIPENAREYAEYLGSSSEAPLLYGSYFNAPITEFSQEKKLRATDSGYVYTQPITQPEYNSDFLSIFPRMWSRDKTHEQVYRQWANLRKGKNMLSVYHNGITYAKPSLWQQIQFFASYQLNHMYVRYFLWNFVGKQNNFVGNGQPHKGNWISGISLIDNIRLGAQDTLPRVYRENPGRTTYFFLPLLLGLLGAGYVFKKHRILFTLFTLLFICTGIFKVVIMNIAPTITFEIDSLFLASYLSFSVFIGFGVLAIFEFGKNSAEKKRTIIAVACGLCSPVILCAQNYKEHTTTENKSYQIAEKLLHTAPTDAIIFIRDNQLFETAQYIQVVKKQRVDIQTINWNHLNNPRYISELRTSHKNKSTLSVPEEKYTYGVNEEVFVLTHSAPSKKYYPAQDILDILSCDNLEYKAQISENTYIDFIPSPLVCLAAQDISTKTYHTSRPLKFSQNICFSLIEQDKTGTYTDSTISKNQLVFLDILNENNWERPICFSQELNPSLYFNLNTRCISKGIYSQLFPIPPHTQIRLDKYFVYSEYITNPKTENRKNIPESYLSVFTDLSRNLLYENRYDSVRHVLSTQFEYFPIAEYPEISYSAAHTLLFIGDTVQAFSVFSEISSTIQEYMLYYLSLRTEDLQKNKAEITHTLQLSIQLFETALEFDKVGIANSLAESTTLCIEHLYDFTEQITISDPQSFMHKNQWIHSLSKKNMNIAFWYNKMKVYLRN